MSAVNLPYIQKEMIRYGMSIYFVLGIVGNICNCMMFTRHLYRQTPSSIYFLSLSIFGIMYLIWSVVPNFYTLNHSDPANQSLFYCKVKHYGNHCLGLCLRYVVVFACIDRFFATRTDVRLHSLITVQMATKLVFIMCAICFVIAIHMPILKTIKNGVCNMFGLYAIIYSFYQIMVLAILPPVLMSIFSTLSIRSLHQRHGNQARARQRDRYLMRMVIGEVIVNIFTSIPYSSYLVYSSVTYYDVNKSAQRLQIESFISFFTQFFIYLISVAPFYLFILTSKTFRNEFLIILVKCWDKYILRRVRIVPLNE
jgi:hypothetical protein